jgi:Na+(H+)/acetate symporter ActP
MMAQSFSGPEAAKKAGVPYLVMRFWTTSGFLEASVAPATGRGSRQLYNLADVVAAKAVAGFRHASRLQWLKEGVHWFQDKRNAKYLKAPGDLILVVTCEGKVHKTHPQKLASTIKGLSGEVFHVVHLARLLKELGK